MQKQFRSQVQALCAKYERLGLTEKHGYKYLQQLLGNQEEITDISAVLTKVPDSEKIFNIASQISEARNDQRLFEAFAEFDTIKDLTVTKFYGDFSQVVYLPPKRHKRWPDILAGDTPVEVKLLSPQDLIPGKFFQKLIDKVNKDAAPQLASYYDEHPFANGMIFIRTHQPVTLADISYDFLVQWFNDKITPQPFNVTIVVILQGIGLWDFYIRGSTAD